MAKSAILTKRSLRDSSCYIEHDDKEHEEEQSALRSCRTTTTVMMPPHDKQRKQHFKARMRKGPKERMETDRAFDSALDKTPEERNGTCTARLEGECAKRNPELAP